MITTSKLPDAIDMDIYCNIKSGDEISIGVNDMLSTRNVIGVVGHVCRSYEGQVLEFSVLQSKGKKAYRFERLEDGEVYCVNKY